ncbi:MAG: four helix bundle protein [Verrucomicrobiae bacterium]|nr:four helix bundle protein [Verrucomicrobiae bacterium]MCX7722414.1 four helix bundle protein [Verrucomicrobiae bacterium]MDW7979946.1 four helix bundle protein [Verrucomicrobiales bacterium]
MRPRFRFEKLEVWQDARAINHSIYQLTRKFPRTEMFGMTTQIRRASISVVSNTAEGSGRNSDKDFAHFLEQAYGSLMEVASDLFLALDEGYVSEAELDQLLDRIERLAKRIATLNRSLSVEVSKTPFVRRGHTKALGPRPSTLA